MVIVTKLLYEMRFVVMEKDDHGGGAMDLGAEPVA
jgi:hypothetical protein